MKRTSLISIIAILIVSVGVVVYVMGYPKSIGTPSYIQKTPETNISFTTSPYKERTLHYTIVANFPTTTPLSNLVSTQTNKEAISRIQNWVLQTVTQFKRGNNHINIITPTGATSSALSADKIHTLQIMYLIGSSRDTLSYIFTVYENTGDTRKNVYFKTFVFDTTTGTNLSLNDIFVSNTDYLNTLSTLSYTSITKELPSLVNTRMITDGTSPNAVNFKNFFFDNNKLILLFPTYQVAGYAVGPQTVRIPTKNISSFLKQKYP